MYVSVGLSPGSIPTMPCSMLARYAGQLEFGSVDLTVDEARRRASVARVARLATVDADDAPHIVPVVFAVERDAIFIAVDQKPKKTRDLKRLRNIRENPQVSLLIDQYDDDDWSRLWWVRADGNARIITSEQVASANPRALLIPKYPQYVSDPPIGPFICIAVQHWRGWQYSET